MENEELERIQKELLAEEELPAEEELFMEELILEEAQEENVEDISLDELLNDSELNELLAEEGAEETVEEPAEEAAQEEASLDELLDDSELSDLLREEPEPAFDDPEKIHDPKEPLVYQNFANDYGAQEKDEAARLKEKDERIVMGLMILASALSLGIIGVMGYWLTVLL